jgi:hypothetical protein
MLVTGFIGNSQVVTTTAYNTLADSYTTKHSTMNLPSVLLLVFTIRFLARIYHSLTATSNITVTTAHVQSSTHTLSLLSNV